ncbi:MAG: NUDIX domain-containing protein [Syntrophales bacterium LBB04]|nr:NUDIX domain-containing protein [Syntrophales bacterium LBB04]
MQCNKCGYTFYQNTAAATAAILLFKGKIVFTVRGKEPGKGMLDLPGGFVDYDESAEEGMIREIMEETGSRVKNLQYFGSGHNQYLYKGITYHVCDICFTGKLASPHSFKPSDEIPELRFLAPSEINIEEIAFTSLQRMLAKYLSTNKSSKRSRT